MTCQLNPLFTKNNVDFGVFEGIAVVNVTLTDSSPALPNSNTTLIKDITTAVTLNLLDGQSQDGNPFVEFIQGLAAYSNGSGAVPSNHIVEAMLLGMFEVSGLAVNGYWSSKLFENASPMGAFTRPVSGEITYTLYGWDGNVRGITGLIPFTIVAIIALLLLSWSYHGASHLHPDPSEPLSVMIASAAGDFDWVSKVNIEMNSIESLSTGFAYQKVNGRWTLTTLSQPPVGKLE
jgi:hypothetical protein